MSLTTQPFTETTEPVRMPTAACTRGLARDGDNGRLNDAQVVMEAVAHKDWDALIADFDGICQEMTYAFAVDRWPGVTLEPVVFRLDGEAVAGALMMIQKLPLGLGAIAVAKWGPALRDEAREDGEAIYDDVVGQLQAEYGAKRGMMISILPRASRTDPNPWFAHLLARGFKAGSQLLFPNRYIVNLRLDDEAQRASFAQKWRYHLNKSNKAGLEFEYAGAERMGEFDALYQAMSDRKQFEDHSAYDTVAALMTTEVAALRPELFFVRHEGEIVAGAIIFKAGNTAVYLYGATNDKALPLRAGYFLHWHVIRWLRDNTSADWYDLGGTDGFQGLHQFKKGMVGREGVITPVPPVTNYAANPLAFLVGNGAYMARDAVQHARRFINSLRGDKARPNQER